MNRADSCEKQDSSSEADFVDSVDNLHESDARNSKSNIHTRDYIPIACSVSKSSSFSGITEKEILCNKIKELYHLYSDIAGDENDMLKLTKTEKTCRNILDNENLKKSNLLTRCTKGQEFSSVDEDDKSPRAGRYNKKVAPVPPVQSQCEQNNENKKEDVASAIKATLVLKPGVVKPFKPHQDSKSKEVFLSQLPKWKRRTPSKTKSKFELPISRLMMLPKKMAFWNKDNTRDNDKDTLKRSSWNEFSNQKLAIVANSKQQFRSHENLYSHYLSTNSDQEETYFRARKSSASPTLCRSVEKEKVEKECH